MAKTKSVQVVLQLDEAETRLWKESMKCERKFQAVPKYDKDGVVLEITANFGNIVKGRKLEVDCKICNSPEGPWSESVLFDDGSEIECSEVGDSDSFVGECSFVCDGIELVVVVEAAK